jgi:hypothetical protein
MVPRDRHRQLDWVDFLWVLVVLFSFIGILEALRVNR